MLIDLKVYGIDNEDVLCNVFRIIFVNLIGFLCCIYKKENIEYYFYFIMKVLLYVKREIMYDVFGYKEGFMLYMGLYDVKFEDDFD